MSDDPQPTAEATTTFSSGKADTSPPDLRIIHYNDVYHLDSSSAEPQGGIGRFITVCNEYREDKRFDGQSKLLTLFSGDAFNPSLESSVTKGSHMIPMLNQIGTDCACVGNHDFDFGVKQFTELASKCDFPWLLANVLDPALGENVPLGNAKRTYMMTASNGIKVGIIGLGEREWLETINSLPPNLIYKSASETAKELVPKMREEGAEIIICLSHQREPNDNKLAEKTDGILDIILGGHDHYYAHSLVNGTHVLRSGTDFKQLSYIEARRRKGEPGKWDFDIWRRDIVSSIPQHKDTMNLVEELTSKLRQSLGKPIGWTATPLDARFQTVRLKESNIGNLVCDIMRHYHNADCAIIAGGTIRGDQIYPPGAIKVEDITTCFPFEDPVVLLRVTGKAIWDALENGVSMYPALEGRFPQVSNITFEFNPDLRRGSRIVSAKIGDDSLQKEKMYLLATRGYMGRGKDGYTSLLVKSEGGFTEEIICEESGMLISTMLRQYFMALRTIGQWKHLGDHWRHLAHKCHPDTTRGLGGIKNRNHNHNLLPPQQDRRISLPENPSPRWADWHSRRTSVFVKPIMEESESESDEEPVQRKDEEEFAKIAMELLLMRKFFGRWAKKVGVHSSACDTLTAEEFAVDWTRVIAPVVEGRILMVH